MKLKKRLALLLAAVMITTLMPTIGFAEDMAASDSSNAAPVFTDMPNNWSTVALKNAVDNGLLKGDDGRLRPGDSLTRAEMASIINRAFGATAKATLKGYQDVHEKSWYYEEMGKALQMGTFQGGGDGLLRPQDPITRQEVFVVMARAFKLSNGSEANLNGFADQARISSWAKPAAAALVDAGYIQGANGRLNPKENITRAEFAKILDSMVTGYVNSPGTVDEVPGGNIIINVPGVALKNLAVKGDLIIGDGVGEGNVSIENVTISGRLVIRGGGENSILITGDSNVDSIIIAKVKGKVRVFTADGTEIGEVLADGSDDVILEGNFANIIIQSNNIVVNAVKAKIGEARIEGNNSTLLVGAGSSVETVRVMGNNVTIEGTGSVDRVQVYSANVMVKTMNTAVTAETGSTGVDAAGTSVSTGNTVITRPPATSGGGGSSTPPPPPSDFAGGNGTEASPYQVATAAQLNKVRDHLDKHFIQTADINLGVAPWNQGAGWVPIGDDDNPFTGGYNGNGHIISNLTITSAVDELDVGLFSSLEGTITELGILHANVQGRHSVGILAGSSKGIIRNCYTQGEVRGLTDVGGLVGYHATPGAINQSFSNAAVQGSTSWIGGLVGNFNSGSVRNSYATGKVTGGHSVGGLIGYMPYGIMENCFSAGQVSGDTGLGGLVGTIQTTEDISIINSYWDTQESNQATSAGGGTGYSTSAMIKMTNSVPIYTGWDFADIWGIETGTSYPYLKWKNAQKIPYPTYGFAGGAGTEASPYQVATADQLNKVRDHLNKHFIQTADIDLGESPWNVDTGWVPVGTIGGPFAGSYDGNSYEIRNLTINNALLDNAGLFAYASGNFKRINLSGGSIIAHDNIGLLAGELTGSVEDSFADGAINGRWHIGELIGHNKGVVERCYSKGSISGVNTVGGLVGWNDGNSVTGPSLIGIIRNSYSAASASGVNTGGLAGLNQNYGQIINSFSSGLVNGEGGLVGQNVVGGIVTNSFYDTDTSGRSDSDRGTPLTNAQMTQQASFSGWDFTSVWGINPGVNGGYPFLRWEGHMAGAGTVLDPYQVASKEHLDLVRDDLSAHYMQIENIDLQSISNWEPIGYNMLNPYSPQAFRGSYDGNGLEISNLSTNYSSESDAHIGLFAFSNGATFRNMNLKDVTIRGYMLVGSIVGYLYQSTMENCIALGEVQGAFHTIGGLTGYNHYGTMRRSGFVGNVSGGYGTVGGLTGRTFEALIEECFSDATVTNTDHYNAGGLVGSHESGSIIRNSYARGDVAGDIENGGFVGRSIDANNVIEHCYSIGNVTSQSAGGGFAGQNSGRITSSYYNSQTAQYNDSIKGTPKTTAEMQEQSTYIEWDFTNIWLIDGNYPILRWQPER